MSRRHPQVVNLDELDPVPGPTQGRLRSSIRRLGAAAAGQQLGCSFTEVPAGCAAFPFHWHAANEEALIVHRGSGELRLGDARVALRAGDYVAFPAGQGGAHQVLAGPEGIAYWCLSTMLDPEIAGYPDSGKVGAMTRKAGAAPLRVLARPEASLGYFDGEPMAQEPEQD